VATNAYMSGRYKWYRPQGMLWSDTVGTLSNGAFIPSGFETYSDLSELSASQLEQYDTNQFLVLSDHNRSPISAAPTRIEQRTRMANGTMRSYHIADKLTISTSWAMLPSRSYSTRPDFDQTNGLSQYSGVLNEEYTADGGAGGAEMLRWYEEHTGPFWVFLSYDKFTNFGDDAAAYQNLNKYSQMLQMYISDFSYSVVKRGQRNYDMWDISVTLEEV
jgi:hypothetical protein